MEISAHPRRGNEVRGVHDFGARRGRNKQWVAHGAEQPSRSASTTPGPSDAERRDRGHGRGRGLVHPPRANGAHVQSTSRGVPPTESPTPIPAFDDPVLETQEEREKFYQELVKQREIERKTAIATGKMDDPLVPKRLEDAISIVGTCMDMCPRFERYRRERENNLFEWETIPGTKRVDHKRAVKMYERAAGDKTLPSDLRPPHVLKGTLDYLFHDLLPRGGFSPTFNFIRDRSRSVRNDFTMQHNTGPLAMECHERCARFHILALYLERDREGFSIALEEQQLMNTLQSLKEFYNDQCATYQSPAELEMRIYHRLIHIRDQIERPEPVPLSQDVAEHPMYKLTTAFRAHVQEKSKPITKTSQLRVDAESMRIFGELAGEMMGPGGGGKGMVFLVACLLERLFGKGTVEDIEDIRGGASWGDIIDGTTGTAAVEEESQAHVEEVDVDELADDLTDQDEIDFGVVDEDQDQAMQSPAPTPLKPSASGWLAENFGPTPGASVFGPPSTTAFGPPSSTAPAPASAFANLGAAAPGTSVFNNSAFARKSVFADASPSPFGVIPNTATTNGGAPSHQNQNEGINSFRPVSQAEASSSSLPASTTTSTNSAPSNGFAVPPRVQNNPFLPASNAGNNNSPFLATVSSPPLPAEPAPSANNNNNNIFAPTPKPATIDFTDKGKGKAADLFSWGASPSPSTSSAPLNPMAPDFTPPSSSSSVFVPPTAAAKPVFGVTPIPLFNGFPTSTSTSASSSFSLPAATTKPPANPPLAKIDTTPPVITTTTAVAGPLSPMTPGNPPPLGRVQPISLPSTPTISGPPIPTFLGGLGNRSLLSDGVGASPSQSSPVTQPTPSKATNPLLGFLKNSLQTSNLGSGASGSGASGSGMLSPLVIGSPSSTPLKHSFLPVKPPLHRADSSGGSSASGLRAVSPLRLNGDIKGKGKARAVEESDPAEERDLEARALRFEQRGLAVRRCLAMWQKRTTDRAEWAEACRQSEKYSEKVRRARERGSGVGVKRPGVAGRENGSKRFRLMGSENGEEDADMDDASSTLSVSKKRSSLRRTKYEAPRTDEDLAKRFQENKEEHARRWAQGSFLQILRSLLKSRSRSASNSPSSGFWRIWLSLNPESDATAIWLECKFDVPGSGGQWETETVFSIPVASKPPITAEGYPGVIMFECTPLEGVEDDLERKYRVLDDCSRLREVIKALPEKRHFVPSLLLFVWAAEEPASSADSTTLPADFLDMVNKLMADSVIASFRAFCVAATTTDLDRKFFEAMDSLQLDVEGRLVQSLTLRDIFKLFDPLSNSFISEWTENCSASGQFDWTLYCRLLDAGVSILNKTAFLSMSLAGLDANEHLVPAFHPDWNGMRDSESVFEAVASWLASPQLNDVAAGIIATDLQSHREMGRDFPTLAFVDHLRSLVLYQAETGLQKGHTFFVSTKDIEPSLQQHDATVQLHRSALAQAQRMSMRRSPRRRSRSLSEDTEITSSTYFNKRRRISSNFATSHEPSPSSSPPQANGRTTPSPSNSTVSLAQTDSSSAPRVTIAMLRALTKDVKNKYGRAGR